MVIFFIWWALAGVAGGEGGIAPTAIFSKNRLDLRSPKR
jgi:hypothetical protein